MVLVTMISPPASISLSRSRFPIHFPPPPLPSPPPRMPHQFQTPLFPTSLGNPCPRAPLHLQTKVYYWNGLNVLVDRFLVAGYIGLHLLQPYLRHIHSQRGLPPVPDCTHLLLFSCHTEVHTMVKSPIILLMCG